MNIVQPPKKAKVGRWLCYVFEDISLHIMTREARLKYDLESLWGIGWVQTLEDEGDVSNLEFPMPISKLKLERLGLLYGFDGSWSKKNLAPIMFVIVHPNDSCSEQKCIYNTTSTYRERKVLGRQVRSLGLNDML
ncbi:hypothetical protein WUBG_14401 [Wuchereria bancrofti]|uniref:Uncharacterized protein n=1 Tax=Wuchereria bancrofti TaxID=6293 RepID=J9AKF2_WUCBA|nr:hypothetical protein WUBG_14401 [Wuchereria bancrofti]